jgi:hypothetical protein
VLDGGLRIKGEPTGQVLPPGSTALLPAALGQVAMTPQGQTTLLDAYLP